MDLESSGFIRTDGGFVASTPNSFKKDAVTMKKISMIKTTSSIGVKSISASSS
jgi:hypothetical protein